MTRLPALGPRGEGWVAIQLALFAAVGLAGIVTPGTWSGPLGTVGAIAGALLVTVGGALAIAGIVGLLRGQALTAVPHPRVEARLVDDGVYALVRHPIYGGLGLGAAGWALVRTSWPALLVAVVLLLFLDLKRRREEAWLAARFPGYGAYRSRTRRMIPWLW
ncbi:MAG: isoprenylcysteine carboxylmethyltransferase family protein [Chloroflexota bacterium]